MSGSGSQTPLRWAADGDGSIVEAYEKEEGAIDKVAVSVEEMISELGECLPKPNLTTTPTRQSTPKTTRS